jgi:hypothetical protein
MMPTMCSALPGGLVLASLALGISLTITGVALLAILARSTMRRRIGAQPAPAGALCAYHPGSGSRRTPVAESPKARMQQCVTTVVNAM